MQCRLFGRYTVADTFWPGVVRLKETVPTAVGSKNLRDDHVHSIRFSYISTSTYLRMEQWTYCLYFWTIFCVSSVVNTTNGEKCAVSLQRMTKSFCLHDIHRTGVEPVPLAWKASMITASPSV
jgi:hypothetical protein